MIHVVRFDEIGRADLPDGFQHLDVRYALTAETVAAQHAMVGRTTYPGGSGAAPAHRHPNGEEVLFVLSGSGQQAVDDERYELVAGDLCFIPRTATHQTRASNEDLVVLWILAGAGSADRIGYEQAPDLLI